MAILWWIRTQFTGGPKMAKGTSVAGIAPGDPRMICVAFDKGLILRLLFHESNEFHHFVCRIRLREVKFWKFYSWWLGGTGIDNTIRDIELWLMSFHDYAQCCLFSTNPIQTHLLFIDFYSILHIVIH